MTTDTDGDTAGEREQRIAETEIDVQSEDGAETFTLAEMMADLSVGHYELDAYRRSALVYCDALDERRRQAQEDGEEKVAELLAEIREVAYSLHERIDSDDEAPREEPDY